MYYNCYVKYVKVIEKVERKDRVMRCEKCPQYRIEPLWNRCEITDAECFYTLDDCDLVDDDGNDNGKFDEILALHNHLSSVSTESEDK